MSVVLKRNGGYSAGFCRKMLRGMREILKDRVSGRMGKGLCMAAAVLCLGLLMTGQARAAEPESVDGHTVTPVTMAMTAVSEAAVRKGPAKSYEAAGNLKSGQAVNVCGRADTGWYQIVYGNTIGYVSDKLLTQVTVDDVMLAALSAQAAFVKQNPVQAGTLPQAVQTAEPGGAAAEPESGEAAGGDTLSGKTEAGAEQLLPPVGTGNVIFVGDSRTGQMGHAVGGPAAHPGTAFAACFGGGVEWLSTKPAKKEIDQYVTPGSIIIINYGVNDLSKHNDYIATINQYNRDWREKGAVVYFATVGPVGENQYGKRNWAVEYFNNQLNGRLDGSIGRIDLYGYLVATGYTATADGMHYSPDTYARIFQFLMQSVGRDPGVTDQPPAPIEPDNEEVE